VNAAIGQDAVVAPRAGGDDGCGERLWIEQQLPSAEPADLHADRNRDELNARSQPDSHADRTVTKSIQVGRRGGGHIESSFRFG
jgi:hypothetical protein